MILADELEVEADDQEGLAAFLERKVEDATRRAMRSTPPSAQATLPLVRLRVRRTANTATWTVMCPHHCCSAAGFAPRFGHPPDCTHGGENTFAGIESFWQLGA